MALLRRDGRPGADVAAAIAESRRGRQLAGGRRQRRVAGARRADGECLSVGDDQRAAGYLAGETGTARLRQAGDRGLPVAFELRLQDCLRASTSQRDARTGALTWAPNQPAVTVSFGAPADMDNPQLVKAQGVSGLGLRLLDGRGRDVRLGSRGEPLMLTPGQNTLSYTVAPERTAAPLMAGAYRAALDFRLSYD